jgi:hypothetical protein
MSEMKRCIGCGEWKLLSEFHKQNTTKDGRTGRCKRCKSKSKPKPSVPEGFKQCNKCLQILPATKEFFHAARNHSYGLHSKCKECAQAYSAMYRQANREQILASKKSYREQNRAKVSQQLKSWRLKNTETLAENKRRWREANKEKLSAKKKQDYLNEREIILEKQKLYRQQNIELIRERNRKSGHRFRQTAHGKAVNRAAQQRRRARKRTLDHDFSSHDWDQALQYWVCGRSGDTSNFLAADHWIPLNYMDDDNPGTVPWNIIPLCQGESGCNNVKGCKDPVIWLTEKLGEEVAMQKLAEIQAYFEWVKCRL